MMFCTLVEPSSRAPFEKLKLMGTILVGTTVVADPAAGSVPTIV
jgi:hypothetical protein